MAAADAASTFRSAVKELAQQRGLLATFQSKPFSLDGPGNGGHFNFSLWRRADTPSASAQSDTASPASAAGLVSAMHDPSAADGLSETARHFLAGVLTHAPALEAFCSPTPPCYCRHGNWAPTVANHGPDDRTCAVRVKRGSVDGDGTDCYMELRMASASACAYLVIAALVAAGLDGLRRRLPLPPQRQTAAGGATSLPTNLSEALAALEADEYMATALGDTIVRWFAGTKRAEMALVEQRKADSVPSLGDDEAKLEAWRHVYMEYI